MRVISCARGRDDHHRCRQPTNAPLPLSESLGCKEIHRLQGGLVGGCFGQEQIHVVGLPTRRLRMTEECQLFATDDSQKHFPVHYPGPDSGPPLSLRVRWMVVWGSYVEGEEGADQRRYFGGLL